MEEEKGPGPVEIIAGVIINPVTGQPQIVNGEGVNPTVIFAEAIKNIEIIRAKEAAGQSTIVVPGAGFPRVPRNDG